MLALDKYGPTMKIGFFGFAQEKAGTPEDGRGTLLTPEPISLSESSQRNASVRTRPFLLTFAIRNELPNY